jgi:flagellar basal-body rod modification protein FlgD
MTRIPTSFNSTAANQPFSGTTDAINDLDLGTFLKLMIAELQNQDPLNPMDNKEMLAQISQLREVGATDKLTKTLDSVLLGQNIASSTNLIGADVDALSDDNQRVSGIVTQVSIENGQPKLLLNLATRATPSIESGGLEKGEYSYRVVWVGEDGRTKGLEVSGDDAVSTQSGINNYTSVKLDNLPQSPGIKRIYRTDSSGEGDYRLIATLTDGTQSSYLDKAADDERSQTRQTEAFDTAPAFGVRRFRVSLKNVAEIRAAGT